MSVVPLLLGDSDSLSVSYGMEPEQEALSIVSFKDREAASPVNKLNPKNYRISIYSPAKALFILLTAQNFPHILQVSL